MTDIDRLWLPPPADLALSRHDVHVWRAPLDPPAPHIQGLRRTLAADELRRAERFHFEKHRQHYIVARGLLRAILGRYLTSEPGQIHFRYSPHGKPALAFPFDQHMLRFNLSHSEGLVLYAVTRSREIGIDVEHIRLDFEHDQIAERFFSPQESALLRSLPTEEKPEAFFNCWTRKEAFIKAKGEGLSMPLHQFDVSLMPGEPAKLLNTRGDPQEAIRWSLRELMPGPGYAAALAVEGRDWQLKCWQWTWSD